MHEIACVEVFSKKATNIEAIFTVDLTLTNGKRQIDGVDLVNFLAFLENISFNKNPFSSKWKYRYQLSRNSACSLYCH